METIHNDVKISHIKPAQMAEVFSNNTPVFAEEIKEKHYRGLWIKVLGEIEKVDVRMNYVSFYFNDEDDIHIAANFDTPINNEVSLLNKGMRIEVLGEVFNVAEKLVVIDHCRLLNVWNEKRVEIRKDYNEKVATLQQTEEREAKWWEKPWVKVIKILDVLVGIIAKVFSIISNK